jgi:hypothetical protein
MLAHARRAFLTNPKWCDYYQSLDYYCSEHWTRETAVYHLLVVGRESFLQLLTSRSGGANDS